MASTHLFLYGSLLTGTGDPLLDRFARACCRSLGAAYIRAKLYDLGDYPGAVLSRDGSDRVFGELCVLRRPTRCLRRLDGYECFDPRRPGQSEFIRVTTTVWLLPSRRTRRADVYVYGHCVNAATRIDCGDYRLYRGAGGTPGRQSLSAIPASARELEAPSPGRSFAERPPILSI